MARERLGDCDTLPLTARDTADEVATDLGVVRVAETEDRGKRLAHQGNVLGARVLLVEEVAEARARSARCCSESQRIRHRQSSKVDVILRRIHNLTTQRPVNRGVVKTLIEHRAVNAPVAITVRGKRLEQSCAPGTRATKNEHHLARLGTPVDALEDGLHRGVSELVYKLTNAERGCQQRAKRHANLGACAIARHLEIAERNAHRLVDTSILDRIRRLLFKEFAEVKVALLVERVMRQALPLLWVFGALLLLRMVNLVGKPGAESTVSLRIQCVEVHVMVVHLGSIRPVRPGRVLVQVRLGPHPTRRPPRPRRFGRVLLVHG